MVGSSDFTRAKTLVGRGVVALFEEHVEHDLALRGGAQLRAA
jgi:hypothetical protein